MKGRFGSRNVDLCTQYLFIGHELDGGLGCDFDDIDAVASPQRPQSTLSDHLGESSSDAAHGVAPGAMDLQRSQPVSSLSFLPPSPSCTYICYLH